MWPSNDYHVTKVKLMIPSYAFLKIKQFLYKMLFFVSEIYICHVTITDSSCVYIGWVKNSGETSRKLSISKRNVSYTSCKVSNNLFTDG